MNEFKIDYDLIDEITKFLEVDYEEFENLSFEQRKDILTLHNEIIRNKLKKERNDLIDERNKYQFEMNGLSANMNSKLEEIAKNMYFLT